jgi:5'-3' exonuclease
MGIYHFFGWFQKNYNDCIYKIKDNLNEVSSYNYETDKIDNLLIDMNGIFHTSAQKIFKYGNYKPKIFKFHVKESQKTHQYVFEDVCNTIERLLITVNPQKRLILCVDGCAPFAKQVQMRKRRFKTAMDREDDDITFDSCNLTPGTKFMHNLSQYITFFIYKKMNENPLYEKLEIIFSNEKCVGEGEQKLMKYVRMYGFQNESFVIHGLDADIIMLTLATHFPKFYVLRDDLYDRNNNYLLIDIAKTREKLIKRMFWEPKLNENELEKPFSFNGEWVINDFVFICFLMGNDFLPHIMSLEIIEGGIDLVLDIIKDIGTNYGHITYNKQGNLFFNRKNLKIFFEKIAHLEKDLLEKKLQHRNSFFPDLVLFKNSSYDEKKQSYEVDIENYRKDYLKKSFDIDIDDEKDKEKLKEISHKYLNGMQWVLSYYTKKEIPSWRWFYEYDYAPPAFVLKDYLDDYKKPIFHKGEPCDPFLQLMLVLPPQSSKLLPEPLNNVLRGSQMKKFCPDKDKIEIDYSGKKNEWQGIIKLPIIDFLYVKNLYLSSVKKIFEGEKRRNIKISSYIFLNNSNNNKIKSFENFYGKIKNNKIDQKNFFL